MNLNPSQAELTPSADIGEALQRGPFHADRRLVLMHGWGADADDLLDLADLLVGPEVSVVALRAPMAHPSGMGRQWYNLQPIDWSELPAARKALRTRLIALGCSVPLKRTVLLGFSQGGAMAVDVGGELQLAGIVACSGYPHQGWRPAAEAQPTPVLLSHGLQDPVVPYAASESLKKQLLQAGRPVKLLPFSGQHGIDETVLPEIAAFVRQCLN